MSRNISVEDLRVKKMSVFENIKEQKRAYIEKTNELSIAQYNQSILDASAIILDYVSSKKHELFCYGGLCYQGRQFPVHVDYKRFASKLWWSDVIRTLSDPNLEMEIDYSDHGIQIRVKN